MTSYFLRVEGVNLASVLEDTSKISVARGSGLLLLEAPREVERRLNERGWNAETLSLGASVGVYALSVEDDEGATAVRADIESFLRRADAVYRHLTFAVDVTAGGDGEWPRVREELLAQVRWRQMCSPTIAVPDKSINTVGPCAYDHVRPAAARTWATDNVSESVFERIEFGRRQRQSFFQGRVPGAAAGLTFTDDLEDLAKRDTGAPSDGKIAVVYIDGNGFGSLQDRLCRTSGDQTRWDAEIRRRRDEWLAGLLELAAGDGGFKTTDGEIRVEVLKWGGDELMLVVPGWRGWRVVASFFDRAKRWVVPGGMPEEYLKHAAGVVFCHHKAPLPAIRHLAEGLCGAAKGGGRPDGSGHAALPDGRSRNLVAYEVLESFDHVGPDVGRYREKKCPEGITPAALLLDGEKVGDILKNAPDILVSYPSKQLHEAVARMYDRSGAASAGGQIATAAAHDLPYTLWPKLDALVAAFGGGDCAWLHLAETWDYLEG